jgi:hypothetical protein
MPNPTRREADVTFMMMMDKIRCWFVRRYPRSKYLLVVQYDISMSNLTSNRRNYVMKMKLQQKKVRGRKSRNPRKTKDDAHTVHSKSRERKHFPSPSKQQPAMLKRREEG